MVSIAQTSRKYRGRKAETYEAVRRTQRRWKIENEVVERMLRELRPGSVLDCPVGTGRFLPLYRELSVPTVHCVDVSEEMLALARKKKMRWGVLHRDRVILEQGDASKLRWGEDTLDVVVCVRFLDLIEEEALRRVVRELCRVARRAVILTVRLGESYVPKSNTATHHAARFARLVASCGFRVGELVPVLSAGWSIVRLERRQR